MTVSLAGRRIVLGVSGGIGAYKAAQLARLLVSAGAEVDTVLTRAAQHFVGEATFAGITGRPVRDTVWQDLHEDTHVSTGRRAEAMIVYPATAHTLARMATGLADDLLSTCALVVEGPIVVAPAMHSQMWGHPATVTNVATLRARGVTIVGPDDGPLMGGDTGPGRLVEPDTALATLVDALGGKHRLAGRHVLVTAGGTREPIDTVRFIGNRSSGRMGFAIAQVAANEGAEVVLVAAPSQLATPPGVVRVDVTTAQQMHDAVMDRFADVDVVVKAAAVADFRPEHLATGKLKKEAGPPVVTLVPNPDILTALGQRRGAATKPLLVGFAAETDDIESNARRKLAHKGADLLVVNDVSDPASGFDVDRNEVALLDAAGSWRELPAGTKHEIAARIVDEIVSRLES